MELKLFTTFIVVAAILASPKHKRLSPGVIVPVFIEFTGSREQIRQVENGLNGY